MDFLVSEFKTNKLFVSFQSRERIQRVRMFFFFFPTSTRYERLITEDGNHLVSIAMIEKLICMFTIFNGLIYLRPRAAPLCY